MMSLSTMLAMREQAARRSQRNHTKPAFWMRSRGALNKAVPFVGDYVVTSAGVRRMLDTSEYPGQSNLVWLTPQAVEAERQQALRPPYWQAGPGKLTILEQIKAASDRFFIDAERGTVCTA
jgi:hypothetical protein